MNFAETGLKQEILDAIIELGFETPTPIQEKTIPHLLSKDTDLVGLAQTGTGKTAAFGLPIVHIADEKNKSTQALVLCPTRELCLQIANDIKAYSKNLKLNVVAVYGGTSMDKQVSGLRRGAQIVVGTPGRVNDLINRKYLKVENINTLVLDEADEMLTMGFKDELDSILENTPAERQTLLFSATMPKEIARIAKKYMNSPDQISAGETNKGADTVEHHFYMVHAKDRYLALKRICDINPDVYGIIFCRTRKETKDVAEKLMGDGYNADALHGDLSQAQRDYVMNRFRIKNLQILVATDVAARGLDVNDLTHVINYNLPDELEAYIHRSGRTGRAGKKGISIAIIHTREMMKIKTLERKVKQQFERKPVPNGSEICKVQLFNLIEKVKNIEVDDKNINEFLPEVYEKFAHLDKEELIKHFLSVEFNSFLDYYKDAKDLNVESRGGRREQGNDRGRDRDGDRGRGRDRNRNDRGNDSFSGGRERGRDRGSRNSDYDFSRFHINVGSKNDVNAGKLLEIINGNIRKRGVEIGKIEILKKFSFFEVDSRYESEIIDGFSGKKYKGDTLLVEKAVSKQANRSSEQSDRGYSGRGSRDRKKKSRRRF